MAGKLPSRIGRYRILCELGHGGMAVLYLARAVGPAGFERLFAIKTIHEQLTRDPAFVDMFLDEARLAARIQHPNAVAVYEVGEEDGRYFIAMDYVNGETLAHTLTRSWKQKTPFPIALTVHVGESICEALHAAHELTNARGEPLGVVHRDVSPQNVMIGYDGIARIMDFGVAKAADRLVHTRSGTHKGKVAYMAPEQVKGGTIDRRVDLFALGVVLWESLVGKRLFKDANDFATAERVRECRVPPPESVRGEVPEALGRIVMRALARDPEARYPTARALGQELHDFAVEAGAIASAADVEQRMKALFPDRFARRQEMARRAAEADELVDPRTLAVSSDSGSFSDLAEPAEKSPTHPELASPEVEVRAFAGPLPAPGRGRIAMIAGALLVGALSVFVLVRGGPREEPAPVIAHPAAPAPPPVEQVRLEFDVEPKDALIVVDGRTVAGPLVVARSTAPLTIEVTAAGHRTYSRTVIPDQSRVLAVKLEPEAPPEPHRRHRAPRRPPKSRLLLQGDDL